MCPCVHVSNLNLKNLRDVTGTSCRGAGSGSPVGDSGSPVGDSGSSLGDSGSPVGDSGSPVEDSGSPVGDSGSPVRRACAAASAAAVGARGRGSRSGVTACNHEAYRGVTGRSTSRSRSARTARRGGSRRTRTPPSRACSCSHTSAAHSSPVCTRGLRARTERPQASGRTRRRGGRGEGRGRWTWAHRRAGAGGRQKEPAAIPRSRPAVSPSHRPSTPERTPD